MIIDALHSVAKHLPSVKAPETPPSTKERLMWTGVALVLFFLMYNTLCVGVKGAPTQGLEFLQTITASNLGSLLTAGIGPVVLASIFLQLFVGAGIINLDMKNKNDKQKFHEVQKILAIMLAFIEGAIFVMTGRTILADAVFGISGGPLMLLVILQIAIGSIIVIYLDELVTKYGLGSGISLFIAAGVSLAIVGSVTGAVVGDSDSVVAVLSSLDLGAAAIPAAIKKLVPLMITIIVFLAIVYLEGVKVEIPIAFERVRGMVPKLPLKFFYVSNIPVIFASALLLNLQLMGASLFTNIDLPMIAYVQNNQIQDGLLYYFTPIYSASMSVDQLIFYLGTPTVKYNIPQWVHAITYVLFLSFVSILFGVFWVQTANMDAKSVAGQLSGSGLQIPGFRRDPRMLEKILHKHIFPLTVLGSFSVGMLAGLVDLTGAYGTGTGILLTVGILYRMYEQLEQMQAFEMYSELGKILG